MPVDVQGETPFVLQDLRIQSIETSCPYTPYGSSNGTVHPQTNVGTSWHSWCESIPRKLLTTSAEEDRSEWAQDRKSTSKIVESLLVRVILSDTKTQLTGHASPLARPDFHRCTGPAGLQHASEKCNLWHCDALDLRHFNMLHN